MRAALVDSAVAALTVVVATAALAWPAWWIAGVNGLIGVGLSGVLCVAPLFASIVLSVVWTGSIATQFLVSSGIRMSLVLVAVLILRSVAPGLGLPEFHAWLIALYLVALFVETVLVVRRMAQLPGFRSLFKPQSRS